MPIGRGPSSLVRFSRDYKMGVKFWVWTEDNKSMIVIFFFQFINFDSMIFSLNNSFSKKNLRKLSWTLQCSE